MGESVKRVLFVNSEIFPYLPESDIANIGRYLPQGIQERKKEIRSFMPRYGCINERKNQLHEVIRLSGMNIVINDVDRPLVIKVASISAARMQVYFIDNEDYFHRNGIAKDSEGNFFDDNDERGIFYVRSVLETIKKLRWTPDIIHINGWISAVAPLYLKTSYASDPFFANSKIIYSVYGENFECPMREGFDERALYNDIEPSDVEILKGETLSTDMLNKIAINFSDAVIVATDSISADLEAHIKAKGIPCLPYAEDNLPEKYWELFCEVYPELKEGEKED